MTARIVAKLRELFTERASLIAELSPGVSSLDTPAGASPKVAAQYAQLRAIAARIGFVDPHAKRADVDEGKGARVRELLAKYIAEGGTFAGLEPGASDAEVAQHRKLVDIARKVGVIP